MRCLKRKMRAESWTCFLAGLAALAYALPAPAQTGSGMSGSGTGGSGTGSSGLGITSGSSGGLGGTGSSGSAFGISGTGGGTGGSTGGLGRTGTGAGTGTSPYSTGGFGSGGTGGTGNYGTAGGTFFPTPSQNNLFTPYMKGPLIQSQTGTNGAITITQPAFGKPMYATVTTTNTGGGSRGGGGMGGGTGSGTSSTQPPRFTASPDIRDLPTGIAVPNSVQLNVQGILNRSSLFSRKDVKVSVDGSTVVLQGKVGSDRERQLAEGLVRLERGVHALRNELQVAP